jgi:integrase
LEGLGSPTACPVGSFGPASRFNEVRAFSCRQLMETVAQAGDTLAARRGLGKKMREWCDAAGVPPMVDAAGKSKNIASHGLRKLCLTRLAETGCNVFQIAAISGHKDLREVQLYVDAYNRKKAAGEAIAMLVEAQNRNVVCLNGKDS